MVNRTTLKLSHQPPLLSLSNWPCLFVLSILLLPEVRFIIFFQSPSVPSMIPSPPPVLATHIVFTIRLLMPPVKLRRGTRRTTRETICILPFGYSSSPRSRSAGSSGAPASPGFGSGWSGYQPAPPVELFKIGLGTLTGFFGNTVGSHLSVMSSHKLMVEEWRTNFAFRKWFK